MTGPSFRPRIRIYRFTTHSCGEMNIKILELEKNKARQWKPADDDGVIEHIKAEAETEAVTEPGKGIGAKLAEWATGGKKGDG